MKKKPNGEVLHGLFEPAELQEMAAQHDAKKAKKKTEKGDTVVTRCIAEFYAAYVRRHNPLTAERWLQEMSEHVPVAKRTTAQSAMILPMIKGGKDGSLMKKMLATWGEERVMQLIADFFGDAYTMFGVINSNQDIGALFSAAPRLLVREHAAQQPRRTVSNLDAAARAMGRRPRPIERERLQLPQKAKE